MFALVFSAPFALAQEALPSPNGTAPPVAPPLAQPAAEGAPTQPPKKIVNNPFAPGGVVSSDQTITRKEVMQLLAEMETRLKKEMGGDMNSDAISRLILNATGGKGLPASENFIGCVNGVPLYRDDEGALSLGTNEPEELKLQRCPG